jgi:hypothetical protein
MLTPVLKYLSKSTERPNVYHFALPAASRSAQQDLDTYVEALEAPAVASQANK